MALVTLTRPDSKKIAVEADEIKRLTEGDSVESTIVNTMKGRTFYVVGKVESLAIYINAYRTKGKQS